MVPSTPLATYRVQFTPSFDFDDAVAAVPYLKDLGVSHLYASPFLKAHTGSSHGYDIVDHGALNPELGGEEAFNRLCRALNQAGIGLILDFVPNHMSIHYADNPWWLDVLEWGPKSPYAASFDIDWQPLPGHPRAGVLVPILGCSYGEALSSGEIELRYDAAEGTFSAWYYEHRLPIGPSRYGEILQKVVVQAGASETPAGRRLLELAARYRGPHNPPRDGASAFKAELAAVADGKDIIGRGLRAYHPKSGETRRAPSPARAPVLSTGALEAGRQRDQLSTLFRHQFVGRASDRRSCHLHCRTHPRRSPDRPRLLARSANSIILMAYATRISISAVCNG